MKPSTLLPALLPFLLVLLAGCGESGASTADVVQAATKGVAEFGQQLAAKVAELSELTPEVAKAKMQELVDAAAEELRAVKDSETAHRIAEELQPVVDRMVELGKSLGAKLNLAAVQQAVLDLIEKFKNDPRVVSALKALQDKLRSLTD